MKGVESRVSNYRPDSLTVVTFYILETVICSSVAKHLENTYLGHSYYSSLLMTSRNTYSYRQLVYLQMTVYYTEIFKMKRTRNYFRKTWATYSDGNLTGKWSFIPVNASFYVSPKNLDHLHEHKLEIVDSDQCLRVTIHTTINWNTHIESITKKATRPGSLFKETCNTVHKEQRMYATQRYWDHCLSTHLQFGTIYLRQHPAIRKRTKTISQVCNEQLSIK